MFVVCPLVFTNPRLIAFKTLHYRITGNIFDWPPCFEHARGASKAFLHIILDGRSTDPGSAPDLLRELGGFGEQGRSALLVEGNSTFLIDYGVKNGQRRSNRRIAFGGHSEFGFYSGYACTPGSYRNATASG